MDQLTNKKQVLKRVATNDKKQATFLPILQKATNDIKKLIVVYFFLLKPISILREKCNEIIKRVEKSLPSDIINRDSYIDGLLKTTNAMILAQNKQIKTFNKVKETLINTANKKGVRLPDISTPKQLSTALKTNKNVIDMWSEAKGSIRIPNYDKVVDSYINGVSKTTMVSSLYGKNDISIWQRAELDLRYENQMKMLKDMKESGVDYAYISSHPDCSKRCEKWQGKLVALNKKSTMSGFRVEKLDNQWVYSLPDIMAQKDKYGYENNIICGFNCRHYLIPYKKGMLPPKEYDGKDIAEQRKIETTIRAMEREIRKLKTDYQTKLASKTPAKMKEINLLKREITLKIAKYKAYCEKNGYAWEQYRIE